MEARKRKIERGYEYEGFFPPAQRTDTFIFESDDVTDTLDLMEEIILSTLYQTKHIAQKLKGRNIAETCRNIHQFIVNYFQYKLDEKYKEQIREPARSWADRKTGIDCDCMSTLIASILYNLGIPFHFRITKYNGKDYFQHVYIVAFDENQRPITIDGVVSRFNYEVPYSYKEDYTMKNYRLAGIGDPDTSTPNLLKNIDLGKIGKYTEKYNEFSGKLQQAGISPSDIDVKLIKTDSIGGFLASMGTLTDNLKLKVLDGVTGGLAGKLLGGVLDGLKYLNPLFLAGEILGNGQQRGTLEHLLKLVPDQIDDMTVTILRNRDNANFDDWISNSNGWIRNDKEHEEIIKTVRNAQREQFNKLKESYKNGDWMGLSVEEAKAFSDWIAPYGRRVNVTWESGGWKNLLDNLTVYRYFDLDRNGTQTITAIQLLTDFVTAIKDGVEPLSGKKLYQITYRPGFTPESNNPQIEKYTEPDRKVIPIAVLFDKRTNVRMGVLDTPSGLSGFGFLNGFGAPEQSASAITDVLKKDFNVNNITDYMNLLANPPANAGGSSPPATTTGGFFSNIWNFLIKNPWIPSLGIGGLILVLALWLQPESKRGNTNGFGKTPASNQRCVYKPETKRCNKRKNTGTGKGGGGGGKGKGKTKPKAKPKTTNAKTGGKTKAKAKPKTTGKKKAPTK